MFKLSLLALLLTSALSTAAYASDAATTAEKVRAEGKAKIDTNGDGNVSKEEFMTAQEKRFAEMDADSNGSISAEEYKTSLGKWKEKRQAIREKIKGQMEEKAKVTTPSIAVPPAQ